MQKSLDTYISYYLPKSVELVAIKKRRAEQAFSLILKWLNKYTKYRFDDEVQLNLTIPIEDCSKSAQFEPIISKYGGYHVDGKSSTWPEGKTIAEFWCWRMPLDAVDELFVFVKQHHQLLRKYSYRISANVQFVLLDNQSKPLPHQDLDDKHQLSSEFFIFLSDSSSVMPNINLPFKTDDSDFKAYFSQEFKTGLPFKVNEKYLRQVTWRGDKILSRKL